MVLGQGFLIEGSEFAVDKPPGEEIARGDSRLWDHCLSPHRDILHSKTLKGHGPQNILRP